MKRAVTWALTSTLIASTATALPHALAAQDPNGLPEGGIPVIDDFVIDSCDSCHDTDDDGRMSRISYVRKTPEGWEATIRRMVVLNGVDLEPEAARRIVRYLSNRHGIAPDELRPGLFEVERRLIEWSYDGDEETEATCSVCHSLGRVITQRRTEEEWDLLMATHRGLYPLSEFQALMRGGKEDGEYAMDRAVSHLSEAFPLQTPEWSAWSATMRPPRLAGRWTLEGYLPGEGPIFGQVEIEAGNQPDEVTTVARYTIARTGREVTRSGSAILYTGYQWRGRSFEGPAEDGQLREVMMVDRDWQTISGRWFTGGYDEEGPDVTLMRASGSPVMAGAYPRAIRAGAQATEVELYGADLPSGLTPGDLDVGPGVRVTRVDGGGDRLTIALAVDPDAREGSRDLFMKGTALEGAIVVYDEVDRIEVTPRSGMARVGGANFPKGFQQFEAIAFSDGPDDEGGTEDDLELGLVEASWSMEEYAATMDDHDLDYVGELDQNGLFTPALDGPNPSRVGNRNNVGDVWVVAQYTPPGATTELRARAHLIVTVPLYMRWEPWRVTGG